MKRKFFVAAFVVGLLAIDVVVSGNAMALRSTQTADSQPTKNAPKRKKGNKVKRATDDAARDTARAGEDAGRATGEAVARTSKDTAKGTKDVVKDTSRATEKGVAKTGKATAKASKKVGKAIKKM